jgi:hypothetical protein
VRLKPRPSHFASGWRPRSGAASPVDRKPSVGVLFATSVRRFVERPRNCRLRHHLLTTTGFMSPSSDANQVTAANHGFPTLRSRRCRGRPSPPRGADMPAPHGPGRARRGGHVRKERLRSISAAIPRMSQEWRGQEKPKIPRKSWCCRRGLNARPLPYQGSALPLSYGSVGRET